jgi:hypothetical protein
MCQQLSLHDAEADVLHLLGDVAIGREPPACVEAVAHYHHAQALADERGLRPLVAHCHLSLGRLHGRTGKHEQAHEYLTAATTMYREMDMRFWLEKAEVQMGEPG